jgi:hypothetical protein
MDSPRIPQLQESNGCIQVDDMVRLIENDPAIQKIPVPNGGQLRNYILYQAGYEGYNAELFPDGVGGSTIVGGGATGRYSDLTRRIAPDRIDIFLL